MHIGLKMTLLSIQVGTPKSYGAVDAKELDDRLWTTGFFKAPISGPIRVSETNLEGDAQADLKNHGGVDKAVCCYPKDHWPHWENDLNISLPNGAFGENFTTLGADENQVCIGDLFECGTAVFQISQPRQPCWKLARRWRIKDLAAKVERTGKTGWYFRIIRAGHIEAGSQLVLAERPFPEMTVAYANEVMHQLKHDFAAARRLASCPLLSESWKTTLSARAEKGKVESSDARLKGTSE